MKARGILHERSEPIETNLAFEECPGLLLLDHPCLCQRIAVVLLHHSAPLHVGKQIRHRASLAVMDSTCSLLAPRVLAQRLLAARCALSHVVNACAPGIETWFDGPLNGSFLYPKLGGRCACDTCLIRMLFSLAYCLESSANVHLLALSIATQESSSGHYPDLPRCGWSPRRPERLAMPHTFSAQPKVGAPAGIRQPNIVFEKLRGSV